MLLTYDYQDEKLLSIITKLVATHRTCFGKNIVIELSRSKCLVIKDGLVIIILSLALVIAYITLQ